MNPRWHPLWRLGRQPFLNVLLILLALVAVDAGLGLAASGRLPMRDTGESIGEL